MKKLLAAALVLATLVFQSGAARAEDETWKPLDSFAEGDRQLAQTALAGMFGEDPSLWPDWLELTAIYAPKGKRRSVLIVRYPMRQACGPWGYVVLSPVDESGSRTVMGQHFCANDLSLGAPVWQSLPDLQFDRQGFQDASGDWSYTPARWHWDGKSWVHYLVN